MPIPTRVREQAVRAYLTYLHDPQSALDPAEVKAAEDAAEAATDVVEKVMALTRLDRATRVDEGALRDRFVEHAAAWCKRTGATPIALRQFGVPIQVLVDAGLAPPISPTVRGNERHAVSAAGVDIDDIARRVPRGKSFRVAEFAVLVGRHVSTARNHLARLVDMGVVEDLGPDPEWSGRGKPPVLYRWCGGGESGI